MKKRGRISKNRYHNYNDYNFHNKYNKFDYDYLTRNRITIPIASDRRRVMSYDRNFLSSTLSPSFSTSHRFIEQDRNIFSNASISNSNFSSQVSVPVRPDKELSKNEFKRMLVCSARKIRRQVLFALGRAGKGVRNAKPVWTDDSYVKC